MINYISVYKDKTKHSKAYLIFSSGLIFLGVSGLLFMYLLNTRLLPYINAGGYIAMIFNGIISTFIINYGVKKSKYFISWDEKVISFYLPDSAETKIVKLNDIMSVDFANNNIIIIRLINHEIVTFNINFFFFPERKTITDMFERLKEIKAL